MLVEECWSIGKNVPSFSFSASSANNSLLIHTRCQGGRLFKIGRCLRTSLFDFFKLLPVFGVGFWPSKLNDPSPFHWILDLIYHYFMKYAMFSTSHMQRNTHWPSLHLVNLLSNFEIIALQSCKSWGNQENCTIIQLQDQHGSGHRNKC